MKNFILRFVVVFIGIIFISSMFGIFIFNQDTKDELLENSVEPVVNNQKETKLPEIAEGENPTKAAVKNENIAYCEHFKNKAEIDECKQVIVDLRLKKQAIANFDRELCNDILNENTKRACLELTESGEKHVKNNDPDHLSEFYRDNDNYDEAIEGFEKKIEDDKSEQNYVSLALLYAEKGLLEQGKGNNQEKYVNKAIEYANEAIRINESSSNAHRAKGYAYEIMPSYDKAIEAYNKAIELDNLNTDAFTGRGHTYVLMGDLQKGLLDFEKANILDPLDVYANMNLCTLEKSLGNNKKAIESCNTVIISEDTVNYLYKSQAYLIIGEIYFDMKNYTEAENNYLMAKSISPRDSNVKISLARLYNSKRDLEKAEILIKEVIEDVPTKAQAYEIYAYNLYLQERYDESINIAKKGSQLINNDVSLVESIKRSIEEQLYYIISSAYNQKGDIESKEKYESMAKEVNN